MTKLPASLLTGDGLILDRDPELVSEVLSKRTPENTNVALPA